jgi:Rrf2 family protein
MIGQGLAARCRTPVGRHISLRWSRSGDRLDREVSRNYYGYETEGQLLSSKLTVGAHILTLLALTPDQAQTSEYIAGSVSTNPVVIRRLLGRLREAGIVESQGGHGGGWRLKRPAERITLLDVLRAVEPRGETIALHRGEPNPLCPVGRNIRAVLTGLYDEVERRMDEQLARMTIAGVLGSVQRRERA